MEFGWDGRALGPICDVPKASDVCEGFGIGGRVIRESERRAGVCPGKRFSSKNLGRWEHSNIRCLRIQAEAGLDAIMTNKVRLISETLAKATN